MDVQGVAVSAERDHGQRDDLSSSTSGGYASTGTTRHHIPVMPPTPTAGAGRGLVHLTHPEGSATYIELIDDDAQASAVVGYLRDIGAPFIDDRERYDRYLEVLRRNLRQGMTPTAARDAARSAASAAEPD